ncbi:zinc-binding dehydrogenase [Cohnella panacarvi]|uniref:zinc-binding dehydrogenase n=1 Tax=Cohnella panacarvi TaxID=400776 RepID=UPI00047E7931|nr:zinc-binding dehydrogenase [Cohnella panacarvi]
MTKMVKAAVLEQPGKIAIREFPMPKLEKGGAIARVILSGICGTDKHSYKGESVQYKGTSNEIDIPYPIIQGHENVLIIEEIDELGARTLESDGVILKPGDRVTMCPDVTCGHCWYCKNFPMYPWCDNMQFSYGNMRSCNVGKHLYGGFSEYIYIEPGTRLYKVPDGLPDEMAVLTELLCVTGTLDKAKEFNSFSLEGFSFNDTVVIQGVGPLGLSHIIKARMMGAGKIIVTDISDYKLNLAKEFGADVALNVTTTTEEERIDIVRQHTHGRGADIVVECVGMPHVVPEGLRMLRKAGMYLEPGNFVDCGAVPINIHEICSKNLRIVGMSNHIHNTYRSTMEMMERSMKWFPWDKFISHRFSIDDADLAIRTSMTDESMKVLIDPSK